MNMKKVLCAMLAGATVLSMSAVSVFAAAVPMKDAYDSDGEVTNDVPNGLGSWNGLASSSLSIDPVRPGSTIYVPLYQGMNDTLSASGGFFAYCEDITDTDYFKFDVDKDVNGKLVKSITVVDDKKLGNFDRAAYLKIEVADTTATDENKTTGTIEFKAKNNLKDYQNKKDQPRSYGQNSGSTPFDWSKNDTLSIKYTMWVSNETVGNDDNPDTGDGIVMDPDANDTNTLIWGDDRAALEFESDDDASKFYAKLSTKSMGDIYTEYGDPADADLWFYDFVGSSTIPSTSRAWLTLGIPWDDNDDYTPDPEACYIYELDADGYLVDVTNKFTYSEDAREIPGWSIQTRTLGTYIVSDTELDVDNSHVDPGETGNGGDAPTTSTPDKNIPNTGSSDMVNVAVMAGVLSLAVAGAVAFRKAK
ncbi:MAG TPA: LPXTG cell wall anchor domain-containing protein [Anaerotruncus colihominis]|nr:LPXTG cell wall anchor domain-containing protein [Anaerotruncus colihominis]